MRMGPQYVSPDTYCTVFNSVCFFKGRDCGRGALVWQGDQWARKISSSAGEKASLLVCMNGFVASHQWHGDEQAVSKVGQVYDDAKDLLMLVAGVDF